MKMKTMLFSALVLIGLPFIIGSDNRKRDYWPTIEWRNSSPSDQGMDSRKLEDMQNYITEELPKTNSVLVIRHGYIVFEKYYIMGDQATQRDLLSVTKSVVSALVGIAIREGFLNGVDQKMVDFFPEFVSSDMNPEIAKVTIQHLLTMSSGVARKVDEEFSREVFREALRNDPGAQFFYTNTMGPDILSLILTKTSGLKCSDLAKKYLFGPLGITDFRWSSSIMEGARMTLGGRGLQMTSRDMAKIGYLYLNQGTWENNQIVPPEWVEVSTREQINSGESKDFFPEYGYLWWIRPMKNSSAYSAIGIGGQYIYVMPDLDIVIVITAFDDRNEPLYLAIIDNYVVPAVRE